MSSFTSIAADSGALSDHLWDARVHFMNATAAALPVYLALGVTSVREMGGFLDSSMRSSAPSSKGRSRDLVVLDANPLENIRNTRRIFAVMQARKLYPHAALDSMLARVSKA